jgi:hypothetical protein
MLPVSEGAVRKRCDVTIKGEPGEMLLGAFSDVTVRQPPGVTVLSADLDQAALHGLLAGVAGLGLELMGVSLQAQSGQPRWSDRP